MTFSAYMPSIKEVFVGTKYVLNGINNVNYKMFADAYEDSVTNSACINDICNLIVGEGLHNNKLEGKNPSIYISPSDVRLLVLDYKIQGQCAYQTIWSEGKPIKIIHLPMTTVALNLNQKMQVDGYWYSYDWERRSKYVPRFYPKFDGNVPENNSNITVVKRPSNEPLFSRPSWYAALKWAQIEGLMAQHAFTDVKTGFTGQKIVNWAGGQGLTNDEKQEVKREIINKVSGIDGQRIVVSINNRAENAIIVDNIDPPNVNATYVNYTEECEKKILIAQSYPEILLAGSKTGFSSNAEEIVVATQSVFRRVIKPDREVILDSLNQVFKKIDVENDLFFKDFEEKSLSKEKEGVVSDNISTGASANDKTLEAQAGLKVSVGGVQSLLGIQESFANGTTSYESAINMLNIIFGYTKEEAIALLGRVEKKIENNE